MIKNLIVIDLILIISAFFTVSFSTPKEFYELSSLFIVLFSIPALYSLIKVLGKKRGLLTFAILAVFAITFEYFSIKTGFPYGEFYYTSNVGLKIFDTVPWAIGFAWVPLVMGSFLLSYSFFKEKRSFIIILASAIILVMSDFVLDPGAVALNMWVWKDQGFLYGIPLSNYFGWLISGLFGSTIFYFLNKRFLKDIYLNKNGFYLSFLIIVGFWTYVTMFKGLWIAFFTGVVLLFLLIKELLKRND